jgi:hypothetical protein
MSATVIDPLATPSPSRRGTIALLSIASAIAIVFFVGAAVPYLVSPAYNAVEYTGRRGALLVHIAAGAVALFAGPIQLWLGIADRRIDLHRRLGVIYITAVVIGAMAAYLLAVKPSAGWVFGAGLAGLATAWLATTGLAFMAIRRSLVEQHKEWMIRSYVVTFAFVTFRIMDVVLQQLQMGTAQEDATIMAWAAWAVPLLVTEMILQGRKILAVAR